MTLRGPLCRLLRTQLNNTCQSRAHSVAVLGAPFSKGQKRGGVENGPKAIRDAGLIERLSHLDYPVHDFGDLSFQYLEKDEPYMHVPFPRTVGRANKLLSGAVSNAVGAGHTTIMLGGDHSLAIGSVEGHAKQCPDLCLIWVDAHADINTPFTSPSGNLHGQSVAFMLKELQNKMPELPGFSWVKPFLSAKDLVYIGLRDVDPGEYDILKDLGVQYFTMRDIDRLGIQRVMEVTFHHLLSRYVRAIMIHNTGTPVNGEEIHNTGLLSVMDLVEVNPDLGASREAVESTASMAVDVIASALGQTREGGPITQESQTLKEDTEQLRL
uniref:Arginase n=1 Tax=Oncorhynchus mykiss TaxID=8022 RepID=A0A8C7NP27_ONCMY